MSKEPEGREVLKELIAYVIKKVTHLTGRAPTKTQLMKLLYLIDYTHYERYEQTLSGAQYMRYLYGPYSMDIERALMEMEQTGDVHVEMGISYYEGNVYYRYYPTSGTLRLADALIKRLHEERLELVNDVLERYAALSLDKLLDIVYETPPMRRARKLGERLLG